MPFTFKASEYDPSDSYTIPPIGPAKVIIETATEKESKSGNPMMEIMVRVQDGPGKGAPLWDYIVYNEFANGRFGRIIQSCGKPLADRKIKPEHLVGLQGEVQIKHEQWEGQTRAKIAYWRRPDDSQEGIQENPEDVGNEPPVSSYHPPADDGEDTAW